VKKEPKTYSEAMSTLDEIVGRIERGEVDVDELCASVTEAAALVKSCRARLRTTQEAVEEALKDMDEERKPEPAPTAPSAPSAPMAHAAPRPVAKRNETPALALDTDDDLDPFADV